MKKLIFFIVGLFFTILAFSQEYLDMWHDPNTTDFYAIQEKFEAYFENRDKGRGSGYKQFKRWEMFMGPRVYPSGRLFNYSQRMLREYEAFKRSPLYQESERAANGDWEPLGPMSYTDGFGWNGGVGRINCIAFHPTDANTIYAGAPAGGLWKTTNGGSTWTCLTSDMPLMGVSGIAIKPNAPNTIYMLTGDGDGAHTYSIGVLKSTNGGVTWSETDDAFVTSSTVRGYKLLMHPTNYNILFIAANNGIWRTLNGGTTWTKEKSGGFTDIEFRPGTPDTMYAVSWNYFYKSTNLGDTWTSLHTTDGQLPTTAYQRIALGVTPADAGSVYLLYAGDITGFKGLYYSPNGGTTFYFQSTTPNILGYPADGGDSAHQATWDLAIAPDPVNPDVVYTGGINVWKSTDFGVTWEIMSYWKNTGNSIGYTHADIHALEFNGTTLYCGSDGGVFKTTNGGDDWTDLSSSLNIMQFYFINVEGTLLSGGTQDNGCNQWTEGGTNATHTIGADGFACLVNYNNTSIRFASTQSSKHRSSNSGASFIEITPSGGTSFWGGDWLMHPTDPTKLYLGSYNDLYRTSNSGTSWTTITSPFSSDGPLELAQSPDDPDVFYASNRVDVKRTSNIHAGTVTWTDITDNLPSHLAQVVGIAVDPNNASRIWVVFNGFEDGEKVYYTPDGTQSSATWYNESGSLPNIPVNCIEFEPGSNDGLYIGTDIGVFYKNDNLGDWTFFGNGMPTVPVFDLEIEGSWLYAGTFGQGMWKSELYSTCPVSLNFSPGTAPYGADDIGHWVHQASSSIVSTVIMHGDIGMEVTYQAGTYVRLDPGFEITGNSHFIAKIGSCGSIVTSPNPVEPVIPFRPLPEEEKKKEKIRSQKE